MNPLTDLIFTLSWFALLIWAVRSIIKGFTSKPVRNYNAGTWTTEVTKRIHPEMQDVEEYRDLQNRIEELKAELEDPWEDDDDDDGDVPAIIKR